MLRSRQMLCVLGGITLSLLTVAVASHPQQETAASTGTSSAEIAVSPDVATAFTPGPKPLTTAECEAQLQVACYQGWQLQNAYNLKPLFSRGITGRGKTIVLVEAYGSPTVKRDLATYDAANHLPAPPSFTVIQPAGKVPRYETNFNFEIWALETTLDVDMAHTIAPGANIILAESPANETEGVTGFSQIVQVENYVIDHHLGDVISQSFEATEGTFASAASIMSLRSAFINAFRHHVTVVSTTGDSGVTDVTSDEETYYTHRVVDWPSTDPLVTAVGGTQLHLDADGRHTSPDTVWNDTYDPAANEIGFNDAFGDTGPNPIASNGGVSSVFKRPVYQNGVASVVGAARGVPDITMSAACNGMIEVYQSFPGIPKGWALDCGNSEATPLFAAIVALTDQVAHHRLGLINRALYAMKADNAPGLVPVTSGNNTVSFTQNNKYYTITGYGASPEYNLASGNGTVDAAEFVPTLASYASNCYSGTR
jgi:subtilase family serine protease